MKTIDGITGYLAHQDIPSKYRIRRYGVSIENIVPWHGGIHLSYERIWNKLSIIIQPGYKIITPSEQFFYQFNRVGIRYRTDSNIILNYSIKAHKFAADFIEFGVGYVFE